MAPLYLFEAESDPSNAWAIWKQIFEYVADMYSHAPLKRKRDEGEILPHGLAMLTGQDTNSKKKTMLIILSREQKQVTVETSLEITLEIVNIWKGMNAML